MFELKLNDHKLIETEGDYMYRTAVILHTPSIDFFQYKRDMWVEWYQEIGIRAPTTLIYHKSIYFWSFNVILLGFGFSIAHQNGY